jgi:uncharacterized membrane protein
MMAQLEQATQTNTDVVWWSDHDWRMEAYGYYDGIAFDGTDESQDLVWTPQNEGSVTAAQHAFVDEPHSPNEPGKAMRVTATGTNATQWGGAWLWADERRITELVAQGLSTKQIASRLRVSSYPVQDPPESIFSKSGGFPRRPGRPAVLRSLRRVSDVGSRGTLVRARCSAARSLGGQMNATPTNSQPHHPAVLAQQAQRAADIQVRIADAITAYAGSMPFVYVHIVVFAVWMIFLESKPWPMLTLVVSLEAIFLSTFVMIGQNRQATFQQAKADHDFIEQELELKTNTDLTREIHVLTTELHRRAFGS